MRKNIKRLVAVLVIMAMIISMCSTAFAAGHSKNKSSRGSYKSYTKEVTDQATDPVVEESVDTAATEDQAVDETAETTPEETYDVVEDVEEATPAAEEVADDTVTVVDDAEETAPAAVTYPATEFDSDEIAGVTVHVDAPEGALPEGTTMKVSKVNLDAVQDAVDKTDDITGTVVAAVDITFFDANGVEVEPNTDITVTMTSDEIAKADDPKVVHVDVKADEIEDADVAAENVEAEAEDDAVTFDADQFSVYAVIQNATTIPDNRMLVIKYNDKYYAVQHDGSLMEADNYDSSTNTLTFENESAARFWSLYRPGYGYNRPYQLRYQVNNNSYMYLAPNSANGLGNTGVNLTYSGNRIYNGSNYLGVTENEDGTLSISGNNSQANAAEVYFASVEISSGQVVHHIDILIQAEADVNVSLAYGDYYDASGNKVLTVTRTSGEKGSASETVPINTTDIEHANITAYKSDGHGNKTNEVLDNAFDITGYQPSIGETGEQVRSNGTFLVTTSTQTGTSDTARQSRLDNRVFYTMSVVKPVEFTLKYDYDNDGDLDILYKDDGTPITVTLYVSLSASFDYWDPRNECDGLAGSRTNWERGDIINGNNANYGSGMDFVLGSSSDSTAKVIALEITKHYVDTSGNPITLANDQTLNFNVYTTSDDPDALIAKNIASGYMDTSATLSDYDALVADGLYTGKTLSHADSLKVGQNTTMALIYDYDAEQGIYCIEETNPAQTVIDTNGKVWEYDSTRIETEYTWRENVDTSRKKHVSTGTTSVPEVAGEYTHNGSSHWGDPGVDDGVNGGTYFNEFVEFDVYNIYKGDDYFYVYHSSDNTIERISLSDSRVVNGKFNIANETKTGHLYGGYFKGYTGQKLTDDEIMALNYQGSGSSGGVYTAAMTNGEWDSDSSGCTPYTGSSSSAWKANKAYTVDGTTMEPVKDTVYYLKEVPEQFFRPALYYVYDDFAADKDLVHLYLMVPTDDGNYKYVCGEPIVLSQMKKLYSKFSVTDSKDVTTVYDAKAVNSKLPRGYLTVWSADDKIVAGETYNWTPYFITKDGVKVTSITKRTISIGNACYGTGSNNFKATDTPVSSTITSASE